jgi:hypothetical protein
MRDDGGSDGGAPRRLGPDGDPPRLRVAIGYGFGSTPSLRFVANVDAGSGPERVLDGFQRL